MKIAVYGTLKEGYGNNRLLAECNKVTDAVVSGYLLYNCGFPVAWPSENDSIVVEVWDIGDRQDVLQRLDRLESEGSMYNRTDVSAVDSEGNEIAAQMYVGHPRNWDISRLRTCPQEDGKYVWSR